MPSRAAAVLLACAWIVRSAVRERPKAFVVRRPDADVTEEELIAACYGRVGALTGMVAQ